jgi:hypothetical protein
MDKEELIQFEGSILDVLLTADPVSGSTTGRRSWPISRAE